MHGMLWAMIAAGTLKLAVLALAVAALVKYLFFTPSGPATYTPQPARLTTKCDNVSNCSFLPTKLKKTQITVPVKETCDCD